MVIINTKKNKEVVQVSGLMKEIREWALCGTWRNSVLGRGNSKYKCSEADMPGLFEKQQRGYYCWWGSRK